MLLIGAPLIGQPANPPPVAQAEGSTLTKFDLDFPGGTPAELVKAIEKATGRPLNVIVSAADVARRIPPLKMNGVDVPELFFALSQVDAERDRRASPGMAGIRLVFSSKSPISDTSIWSLQVQQNGPSFGPVSLTYFFLLAPYLDGGLSVDDITTAIQTAWRMQGLSEPPKISFHKETKLLIAVGDESGVRTIDQVLSALRPTLAKRTEENTKKP
ncbi:MAG TPA: hypothetical protein VK477_10530 [Acidobacteriota bacterium]|nr:hypothetical protein [Acidobacteriota bacterium]